MTIKERKLITVGNSTVITVSKEFLEANDLLPGDTVYIDEEKLKTVMTKKNVSPYSMEIDMLINQAFTEYDQAFRDLVEK